MNFVTRFRESLMNPDNIFRKIRKEDSMNAVLYYMLWFSIGMLVSEVFIIALGLLPSDITAWALFLVSLVVLPFVSLLSLTFLVISVAFVHWTARYIFKGKGTFSDLFKAYVYASTPGIASLFFGWIPLLNSLISLAGALWSIVLDVKAISRVHKIGEGSALLALIIPGIVVATLIIVLVVVGYLLYFSMH